MINYFFEFPKIIISNSITKFIKFQKLKFQIPTHRIVKFREERLTIKFGIWNLEPARSGSGGFGI